MSDHTEDTTNTSSGNDNNNNNLAYLKLKPTFSFAARLQYLRKLKGWSQAQLAEASGINISTIQKLETGLSHGRENTRRALARCLQTPLTYLVYGVDERSRERERERNKVSQQVQTAIGGDLIMVIRSRELLLAAVLKDPFLTAFDRELISLIIYHAYHEAEQQLIAKKQNSS